ncbi:MAG: SUMF1/EgtB/PvdO family nonheme iron enzyme [Polyangiaceae bacterium]
MSTDGGSPDVPSADAAPADATTTTPAGCTPSTTQCSDGGVQTCGPNGQWGSALACPGSAPSCGAGVCLCQVGASQCAGSSVETCDSDGGWGSPWTCATATCDEAGCVGATTTGPSCAAVGAGTTSCGPGGSGTESCCTSLEVTGGTFDRLYPSGDAGFPATGALATISGLRLDKYLVTVGRLRQYVNYVTGSAGAPPPNGSGTHTHLNGGLGLGQGTGANQIYETGWDATDWNAQIATGPGAASTWNDNLNRCNPLSTWTNVAGSQENLPINCATWYEAYAFCIWDGGFLPTNAEWEYVSAGGAQQREYPWGSTDPGTANQYAIYNNLYGACTEAGNCIAPVGWASLGASYWGQLDMVGELDEWMLDFATLSANTAPCTNCVGFLNNNMGRDTRGGGYYVSLSRLQMMVTSVSDERIPSVRDPTVGFRCARTP